MTARSGSRLTVGLAVLAGALAITFLVVLGFRLFGDDSSRSADSRAAAAALSATPEVAISQVAKNATLAFLDVDYRDMDPRLKAVLALATGTFHDQYKAAEVNRTAAARQLIPSSTAASARDRRSIDKGLPIHAGLHPASTVNQISPRL